LQVPRTLRNSEWPPNYAEVYAWRQAQLIKFREEPNLLKGAKEHYRSNPNGARDFINHWTVTYDPRVAGVPGKTAFMPFILFEKQADFVEALYQAVIEQAPLLCEKSRDLGITWICCAFTIWLWLFRDGPSIGWGSRKSAYVDTLGDPKSVFEKMRILLRNLPVEFLPLGFDFRKHSSENKIFNPETGATISGEGGDSIGRGGRTLAYFLDEAAHVEHPELAEAGISNNTNVPIYVSSVNGPATVFQRKRDVGALWVRGQPLRHDVTNVFIFDWSDHPEKTVAWYKTEKSRKVSEGLSHIFAQEVERNASAAVLGTIIDPEHVRAAIGAAQKLGIKITGGWGAAADIADGDSPNADRNALAIGQGIELSYLSEWGDRDVGVTTRRIVDEVQEHCEGRVIIDYDCIGVGAGVKAEVNRLEDEKLLNQRGLRFTPWNAATSPLNPEGRVIPDDRESILNKDFYANLKAQGWWQLRLRFERTWRALNDPDFTYDPDELISIAPDLPLLRQLEKELTQVTSAKNGSLKLVVNKTPPGQRSPNLADAVMMKFWPSEGGRPMIISQAALIRSRVGSGMPVGQVFSPAQLGMFNRGPRNTYVGRQKSFNDY
jgi:phage terminase large subunit